uniref:Tetratricopeptide repeat domain 16 n=1 Tax=Crocodylus porosus TaxID=8502 RepID=A0A7M4DVE7_CROPO
MLFFSQGEWEKAVISYSKAINLDPQQVEFYVQRAEAFLQLCDFQSTVLNLRKALSLSLLKEEYLDRMLFVLHLIACLGALNRFSDCLHLVNRDLDRDPKNPDLYTLRARLYDHFNKVPLCYQDIQKAMALEPQHEGAQALMQKLLKRGQKAKAEAVNKALMGDLREAILKINFALENSPLEADPWDVSLQRRISMLLDKLGMRELRRRCVAVASPSLPLPAPIPAV